MATHTKESHIVETFEAKEKMKNLSDQKFLALVWSEDWSNIKKNIEAKQKRAIGIIKDI